MSRKLSWLVGCLLSNPTSWKGQSEPPCLLFTFPPKKVTSEQIVRVQFTSPPSLGRTNYKSCLISKVCYIIRITGQVITVLNVAHSVH